MNHPFFSYERNSESNAWNDQSDLPPEIEELLSPELLARFILGNASPAEQEVVEAALELEPALDVDLEELRSTLYAAQQRTAENALLRALLKADSEEEAWEIEPELVKKYAVDKLSEVEREIVEAAIELDPMLLHEINELREANTFFMSPTTNELITSANKKKVQESLQRGWKAILSLPSLLFGAGTAVATAVIMFLVFRPGTTSTLQTGKGSSNNLNSNPSPQVASEKKENLKTQKPIKEKPNHGTPPPRPELVKNEVPSKEKQNKPNKTNEDRPTLLAMASVEPFKFPTRFPSENLATSTDRSREAFSEPFSEPLPPIKGISPIGIWMRSTPPIQFQWEAVTGAKSYRIKLINLSDTEAGPEEVIPGNPQIVHWKTSALKPGKIYSWQVIAYASEDGKDSAIAESPLYQIALLSEKNEQRLALFTSTDPLARPALLMEIGLFDDAKQELALYLKYRPKDKRALLLTEQLEKHLSPAP